MLIETTSPAASSVGDCIIEDGAAGGAPDKQGKSRRTAANAADSLGSAAAEQANSR
jgi:hypothetical protein